MIGYYVAQYLRCSHDHESVFYLTSLAHILPYELIINYASTALQMYDLKDGRFYQIDKTRFQIFQPLMQAKLRPKE